MSHFLTLATGRTVELPDFRNDVPVYAAPDRKDWQAKHGKAPWPVADVRPVYFTKARRAYEEDYGSLSFQDATAAQVKLDMVNLSVHAQSAAADADLCFFDPTDGQFWIYPV